MWAHPVDHLPLNTLVVIFGHCDEVSAKEDRLYAINPKIPVSLNARILDRKLNTLSMGTCFARKQPEEKFCQGTSFSCSNCRYIKGSAPL